MKGERSAYDLQTDKCKLYIWVTISRVINISYTSDQERWGTREASGPTVLYIGVVWRTLRAHVKTKQPLLAKSREHIPGTNLEEKEL